jgi:pentatricopeptide repeat protein
MNKDLWEKSVEYEGMARMVQIYLKHDRTVKAYQMMQEMEKKKWELFGLMIPDYLSRLTQDFGKK